MKWKTALQSEAQDMKCLGEGDQNERDESPVKGNFSEIVIISLVGSSPESLMSIFLSIAPNRALPVTLS